MKRQPCNYCAARGGKKHKDNCSRPLKVTDVVAAGPTQRTSLRNHIALLIDNSSSMRGLRHDVLRAVGHAHCRHSVFLPATSKNGSKALKASPI